MLRELGSHLPMIGRARRTAWFLGAAYFFAAVSLLRAEITLTDSLGRKATIEVTAASTEKVDFLMQGKKGSIKMPELSEASRAEVVTYAKSKGVYRSFPPIQVQVKVVNQRRNDPNSSYRRDIKLGTSVVVEGAAKLVPLPAAEATIVIVTQETREKYVNHVEKLTVYATDTVAIPAAPSGDRREFVFKTVALNHDAARDYTNVGGEEYKYFLFGLRDAETKQLLDFQTNFPALETYAAQHPEVREKLLGSREKSPFSADLSKN